MPTGLNQHSFVTLLTYLDADQVVAGAKYEDLRRTLVRFFEWRGAPFPDEHSDETLDRVARRLGEGVDVKNIGAYCYSVARLVLLETRKAPGTRRVAIDAATMPAEPEAMTEADEKERRLVCLERCLRELPLDGRELILEYYRQSKRDRIDGRRALAERLGIRAEALANRAQRLRDKLERCVQHCLNRASAT